MTWQRYFVEHFPERRNAPEDAIWLWNEWRTRLLKHESPRGITHGSPAAHWQPLPDGGFIVDLESMWSDFVNSVNGFVAALDADAKRWKVVRARWRERAWTVRSIPVVPSEQLYPSAALYAGAHSVSASYSTSTAMISGQEKLPITLPTPPTIASLENENPA